MYKHVVWVGSSKKDLKAFPEEVQDGLGAALQVAQYGGKHPDAKPWKGLDRGVMEIVNRFDKNAYRTIYTVSIGDAIYVLHAFQKKSKSGIATPREEIELVRERYKQAIELSKRR